MSGSKEEAAKAAKMANDFSIPPCAIMSIYRTIPFDCSPTAKFYCKARGLPSSLGMLRDGTRLSNHQDRMKTDELVEARP